jgi:cytochrome b
MASSEQQSAAPTATAGAAIYVWDLPTRLFHWLTVGLVTTSFVTGEMGGNWMVLHMRCGYTLLTLLLFRLVWGFAGGQHARFAAFVRGPAAVWRYATSLLRHDASRYLGHNPMGGWSVLAMLAALLLQATTGLFANDDIFTEGPLYPLVSKATSDFLTGVHLVNQGLILALIGLHLGAVLFYWVVKRDNLILPMVTGRKSWPVAAPASANPVGRALVILIVVGGAVFWLVH